MIEEELIKELKITCGDDYAIKLLVQQFYERASIAIIKEINKQAWKGMLANEKTAQLMLQDFDNRLNSIDL